MPPIDKKPQWLHKPYHKHPYYTPIRALLIYGAYFIIPPIIMGILSVFVQNQASLNIANFTMTTVILTYGVLLLLYKPVFKKNPIGFIKDITKQDVIFALKCYGVLMIGNIILNMIPSPVPENQQLLEGTLDLGNPMLFGLFTVIMAPLIEELLFRDVFFKSFATLKLKTGLWLFTLNVVIFTVLHTGLNIFVNPVGTLQYAWLSFMFAYSYAKTRDIKAPIIMHLLNNGLAYIAILITQYLMR